MAQSNRPTKEEIKHDQFVETVLRSYDFLKTNLKFIIIVAAIVVLGVGGASVYQNNQQKTRAEAYLAFAEALEKYQEAEDTWLDSEKVETSSEQFQVGGEQFRTIFQEYSDTPFADKAQYNYGKTLYYQGDYEGAIEQFQSIIENHKPENQILALYAQQAIGKCYEQKGEYNEAIEAYKRLPDLPVVIREYALVDSWMSQARCYEKLSRLDDALAIYQDVIDLFHENLNKAIQDKSHDFIFGRNLIPSAKSLIASFTQPSDVTVAERLENEGNYHEAFIAYAEAIHRYKVDKDNTPGGLTKEIRERIYNFETKAHDFLKNLRDVRRYESDGQPSRALYPYSQAVGFDFAPGRNIYEKARFHHDRIQHAPQKSKEVD
jgi:tetratricopeptide (TPR) repeat protein